MATGSVHHVTRLIQQSEVNMATKRMETVLTKFHVRLTINEQDHELICAIDDIELCFLITEYYKYLHALSKA